MSEPDSKSPRSMAQEYHSAWRLACNLHSAYREIAGRTGMYADKLTIAMVRVIRDSLAERLQAVTYDNRAEKEEKREAVRVETTEEAEKRIARKIASAARRDAAKITGTTADVVRTMTKTD